MPTRTVLSMFHLRPRRIGGIETFARELSLQLASHGWTSTLCFVSPPDETVSRFLDLPNVRIDVEHNPTGWNPRSLARFIRLIRRHQPTILHLYFTEVFGPYAMLALLLGVKKVFFTDQISRPEDYKASASPFWKRTIYQTALPLSRVFCISDYVHECWTASKVFPPDRLITLYNSVDMGSCCASAEMGNEFRHRFGLPSNAIIVSQIASLIPEKGFDDLLLGANKVAEFREDVHFVLVGDGKRRAEYERMARQLGIDRNVTFTGLISDPVREGLFAASDIVCQMSRWNEAFGFVIAEAMACGKPMIATRVGGIPELVRDGETGYLVDRGDSDALAKAILRLADDPELRTMLGEQGRRRCARLFDHQQNVSQLIRHYELSSFSTNGESRQT